MTHCMKNDGVVTVMLARLIVMSMTLSVCLCSVAPQQVVDRLGGMAVSPISGHVFTLTCGNGVIASQNLTEWDRQLNIVTVYTGLSLLNPNNAAADPYDSHIVWIADNTRQLFVFNTSDSSLTAFATSISFYLIGDIVRSGVDGDILITHVSMSGQAEVMRISDSGAIKAQYNVDTLTGSLAVDNKGFIYITQSSAVLQLSPNGHIVKNFTTSPSLQRPLGVAVTADFHVLVSDFVDGRLFQLNQAGHVVKIWDRVTSTMKQTGNFSAVVTFQIDVVRFGHDVVVAKDWSVGRILLIPLTSSVSSIM